MVRNMVKRTDLREARYTTARMDINHHMHLRENMTRNKFSKTLSNGPQRIARKFAIQIFPIFRCITGPRFKG